MRVQITMSAQSLQRSHLALIHRRCTASWSSEAVAVVGGGGRVFSTFLVAARQAFALAGAEAATCRRSTSRSVRFNSFANRCLSFGLRLLSQASLHWVSEAVNACTFFMQSAYTVAMNGACHVPARNDAGGA